MTRRVIYDSDKMIIKVICGECNKKEECDMLKYERPKIEMIEFDLEDVVRTSGEIDNIGDGTTLPTPDVPYNPTT